jgi:hypothetical protein
MAGETRSTKYTSDWQLVFLEPQATLQDAMALERRIKRSKSRKSIRRYIENRLNLIYEPISLRDIISRNCTIWDTIKLTQVNSFQEQA